MDILDKILQEKKAPKCSCDTCKTPMTEDHLNVVVIHAKLR